jgi:hypothetical protein
MVAVINRLQERLEVVFGPRLDGFCDEHERKARALQGVRQ